jgi:Na+/proline symporter
MSTELTGKQKALALVAIFALLALVIVVGLVLRVRGPGNMGTGFLQGAAFGFVAAGVMWWRATRHADRATTFERSWTQTGDERDDRILTRSLAVLGLLAFPLTGIAAIAIGLGALVEMVLALLLFGEVLVGVVSFAVISRRS